MAFISEIHYQNSYTNSSGEAEFVEVALTAAEQANAADYVIATYQIDGTVRSSISLDQITPVYHEDLDIYTYTFETRVTSPDHSPFGSTGAGEAEAVAFVNTATSEVHSFYDIGGGTTAIEALEGPAVGAVSTNIEASQAGHSIQFDAFGGRIDNTTTADDQPFITLEVTGLQIGTYATATGNGNGDDMVVTLGGTEALGNASDTYTIIVSQLGGVDYFNNGQFIRVVDSDGNTVFGNEGVNNDSFQGRGAGDPYIILDNGYVIDLRGLPTNASTIQYDLDDDVIGDPYRAPFGEFNFDDISDPIPVPCFVTGTRIKTKTGSQRVENLKVGDLVLTKDNGFQAIIWVGKRKVQFSDLQDRAHLRPIRISQRVLSSSKPLTVSPQHRILASGPNISLLCGTGEVMMSAEQLFKCGAAERCFDASVVSYFHIMFENHELVLSNGTWTESLDPHFLFNAHCSTAQKQENLSLFASTVPLSLKSGSCVRPVLQSYEVCALFA